MPRRQRVHVPGGTYYILRRTHSPRPIFSQPEDYALIESLLPAVLRRTGANLLAYCWMPDAIHLALQVDDAPVGDFMRELTSHYAQHIHLRTGERGQFFRRPYQSTLVDPDAYLGQLVQYLHYIPVFGGAAQHPDDYPYSSHRIYLRDARNPLLHTKPLLQIIDGFDEERVAYRRLMAEAPPATTGNLMERGRSGTPGIVGGAEFIARLPRRGRVSRSRLSLEEIVAHVARSHGVSDAHLRSRSRRHDLVLARAQIAWYATERRVASLCEVARYMGLSASSLTTAITRHQRRQPELFTFDAFAPLFPLISLNSIVESASAEGHRARETLGDAEMEMPG
jgi:REP element-mobilizing transposase RayT/transposase-like protein